MSIYCVAEFSQVILWDDNKQQPTVTAEFRSHVHRVRLSRHYLVVALQNSIHVYVLSSPLQLLSVYETADNPLGLCCLGSKLIAFPGRTAGQIQMVEVPSGNISIIPAHSTPLRALELSPNEEILASASETGTLVRTFSTTNCVRTGELRRGVDRADIYSIAFSPSNKVLAVTSDKATLHVFDVPGASDPQERSYSTRPHSNSTVSASSANEENVQNKWGILGKLPLMPRVFSDTYSFASAHFAINDTPPPGYGSSTNGPIPGIPEGKPKKGIIKWKDDSMILVAGAGRNGVIERFYFGEGENGRRVVRTGWKRYLGN